MKDTRANGEMPPEWNLGRAESSFCDEIARSPGCDTLLNCYQCGVCTGTCPVAEQDERFSPAWIIQWVRLGLREIVLQSPTLWYCLRCHRCSFHCPQGVRFADINAALRARALEEGFISGEKAAAIERMETQLQRARIEMLDRLFADGSIPEFDWIHGACTEGTVKTDGPEQTPPEQPAELREDLLPDEIETPASAPQEEAFVDQASQSGSEENQEIEWDQQDGGEDDGWDWGEDDGDSSQW